MKNSNKIIIVLALVFALGLVSVWVKRGSTPELAEDSQKSEETLNHADIAAEDEDEAETMAEAEGIQERQADVSEEDDKEAEKFSIKDLAEFDQIDETDKESLIRISNVLASHTSIDADMNELVEELANAQMRPLLMEDENPYTGKMTVVRTREVLPGTRYFHAQFFEGEDGAEFVQHMSFEFRPNEQSFDAVKKTVQAAFGLDGRPSQYTEGTHVAWPKDEDYIVWIKKLEESDIVNDPFNSYTQEDIGAIRVAVELEIHGAGGGSFHMHMDPPEEN